MEKKAERCYAPGGKFTLRKIAKTDPWGQFLKEARRQESWRLANVGAYVAQLAPTKKFAPSLL
jgi:hypothetical protein